jgi:hypothetical protein
MELNGLHVLLGLAVVVALAVFARAFFGGSRMLGSFWDRERARRVEAVAAARAQRDRREP